MPTPRSLLAINAVKARLASILVTNGFNTDAGLYVVHGPAHIDANQVPAVMVASGNESVQTDSAGKNTGAGGSRVVTIQMEVTITGFIASDPNEEKGVELELLLADIKRAAFMTATSTFALSRAGMPAKLDQAANIGPLQFVSVAKAPRQDGQEFESVVVTAAVTFNELYGDPYNYQ